MGASPTDSRVVGVYPDGGATGRGGWGSRGLSPGNPFSLTHLGHTFPKQSSSCSRSSTLPPACLVRCGFLPLRLVWDFCLGLQCLPRLCGCWQSGQATSLYAVLMRAPDLVFCAVLKDLIRKTGNKMNWKHGVVLEIKMS